MKKNRRLFGRFVLCMANVLPTSNSHIKLGQKKIRSWCARQILQECGKSIGVEKGAKFAFDISVGDNSALGINCMVGSLTRIGRDVMMGPNVKIYTINHNTARLDIPMNQQGNTAVRPVIIGDDVWIGDSVIILPGSRIGKGAILGAGAVIRGDVPDYAVVIGNPGKVIKYRTETQSKSKG